MLWYFNATTHANESGGPTSALTLRLFVGAFYCGVCGLVEVDVHAFVVGAFASNLRLISLRLTYNQSGQSAYAYGWPEPGPLNLSYPSPGWYNLTFPGPNNATYDPAQMPQVYGPGSMSLSPSLANETGQPPYYEFLYSASTAT